VRVLRALIGSLAAPCIAFAQATAEPQKGAELPLDLDWKAPAECANESALRGELSRVARVKPGRTVSRLAARGRIEKHGEHYQLHLRTERNGEKGERTLSAPECRALEREVTLVLALAFGEGVEIVDPGPATTGDTTAGAALSTGAATTTEPAPAEAPAEKQPVVPVPVTPPPSETKEPQPKAEPAAKPSRLPLAAFAGGAVLAGALPSPAAVVTAGIDVGSRRLWLAPRFLWLPGVDQALPRGVAAQFSGAGGSLTGCLGVPAASFVLGGCAGATALALRGSSQGATESGRSTAAWFAATASVLAEWPAESVLSVRLGAELGVSLNTPSFVVEGLGSVHDVPRLTGSVSAGLVVAPWR
jgi:hypothetical protein